MGETKLLVDIVNEASGLTAIKQAMVLGFVIAIKSNDVTPKEGE